MVFVGLSQFCDLFLNGFCFGRKFYGERGQKALISEQTQSHFAKAKAKVGSPR